MNGSRGSQRKTLSERTWAIALQNTRAIPPGEDFAALMIPRQHGEIWRVPQNTGQLSFGIDGGTGLIGQLPHTLLCSPVTEIRRKEFASESRDRDRSQLK